MTKSDRGEWSSRGEYQSTGDPASEAGDAARRSTLRKELNLFDTVAIVVGTIIGSGIFSFPAPLLPNSTPSAPVLLVWVVGGVLTLFGALSLAELGSIFPGTGGLCTYLRRVYGPLPAFLYAWALLVMIHSGSIAALAVALGVYAGQVFQLNKAEVKVLSVMGILVLTTISGLGIRGGKLVQNLIAVAKVSGLAGIILLLTFKGSRPIHLFDGPTAGGHAVSLAGFGIALVAVLWAYEGWHVVSFIAGEMKWPQLDLPRAGLSRRRSIPWTWWRSLEPTSRPSGFMAIRMNATIRRSAEPGSFQISSDIPATWAVFECRDFDEAGLPVEVGV